MCFVIDMDILLDEFLVFTQFFLMHKLKIFIKKKCWKCTMVGTQWTETCSEVNKCKGMEQNTNSQKAKCAEYDDEKCFKKDLSKNTVLTLHRPQQKSLIY